MTDVAKFRNNAIQSTKTDQTQNTTTHTSNTINMITDSTQSETTRDRTVTHDPPIQRIGL
jgi:hypothetical protein